MTPVARLPFLPMFLLWASLGILYAGAATAPDPSLELAKAHLLQALGLESAPQRPPGSKPPAVPDHMARLFERWQDEQGAFLASKGPVDTVRSHTSWERGADLQQPSNGARFRFNVTSTPGESLLGAELRLYRLAAAEASCPGGPSPVEVVRVYEVLRPATRRLGEAHLRLLDTRALVPRRGWLALDVFPAVQRWVAGEPNHGLYLRVSTELPAGAGSNSSRLLLRQGRHEPRFWDPRQPVLLTYSAAAGIPPKRTKRAAMQRRRKQGSKQGRDACRRFPLRVEFSHVGWNDWIVAPPSYEAYYCHGVCPFPLPDHLNGTNHAIVQTLVNSMRAGGVPNACCVPTELSPVSLLYVDAFERVVLKNYQDMVVEGCGCR